jgi:hypothetical protein
MVAVVVVAAIRADAQSMAAAEAQGLITRQLDLPILEE